MAKSVRMVNGYRLIYKPEALSAMTSDNWKGYVYEHVYIAERDIGRSLSPDEVVHHLDGDRQNNEPSNLLVLSRGMHARLHSWFDKGAPMAAKHGCIGVNSAKAKAREPKYCEICSLQLTKRQKRFCSSVCAHVHKRVVDHPSKDELSREMASAGWVELGRKYGVSDVAVRKWAKQYGLLCQH